MVKGLLRMMAALALCGILGMAHAEAFEITYYDFVWYAASVEDVKMDIKKSPNGLAVILRSPGGKLATISAPPAQAEAIGKVLRDTGQYYDKQMKKEEMNAEDMVPVGKFKVYFKSSRGRNFEVNVRGEGVFSAAVVMTKDQALKMADHLLKAEEMAALVDKRVRP